MTSRNVAADLKRLIAVLKEDPDRDFGDLFAELKALMTKATPGEVVEALDDLDMVCVFQYVNGRLDSSQRSTDNAVDVVRMILDTIPCEYVVTKMMDEVVRGLNANGQRIRNQWLKVISRCIDSPSASKTLTESSQIEVILLKTVDLLDDDSPETFNYCKTIAVRLGNVPATSSILFSDEAKTRFNQLKTKGDVVKLRVYELMVALACSSRDCFAAVLNTGHLNDLIKDVNVDDPLVALNCIEIMTDLALTKPGIDFLEDAGVIKWLADRFLGEMNDDPMGHILMPGYIRLFGLIGQRLPSLISRKYPHVLGKIFKLLETRNQVLLICVVDAIGFIGNSLEGKNLLNTDSNVASHLRRLGTLLNESNTDIKARVLCCITSLLEIDIEKDVNGEGTTMAENWFNDMQRSGNVTATIFSLARQPFQDLRLNALHLVRVLCMHIWGQKELVATTGLMDYLLDRRTETTKEGKEAKFAIIRELHKSSFTSLTLKREVVLSIRKYYKEGPFFVETETAVATEGQ